MKAQKLVSILVIRVWINVIVALTVGQDSFGQTDAMAAPQPLRKQAGEEAAHEPVPRSLPAHIVEQWTAAGADAGWLRRNKGGSQVFEDEPHPGALPAFQFTTWPETLADKWPDPGHPFGLVLFGANVTDAGLKELAGLTSLERLDLVGTDVTDAGIEKLKRALPHCRIHH